jgi:FkbM family methyltransferase
MEIATYPVAKNGIPFVLSCVKGHAINERFIQHAFPSWEAETYNVIDKYLQADSVFVDIGAWIGPLSLYAAYKCRQVLSIEVDRIALACLKRSIELLHLSNVHLIEKALYNTDDGVVFGKNQHLAYASLGDSTSQISSVDHESSEMVASISVHSLIEHLLEVGTDKIGLVKIDIEGGEEHVLRDLCKFCSSFSIPLYVSFHLPWWTNLNWHALETLLSEFYEGMHKIALQTLRRDGFATLLFVNTNTIKYSPVEAVSAAHTEEAIPVYVIAFNNPTYVQSMINQLRHKCISSNVIIVDNGSTFPPMIELLQIEEKVEGTKVIRMERNFGHKVVEQYISTPDRYIVTDPDLLFNRDMPSDVIMHLVRIADETKSRNVGLALSIPKNELKPLPNYFRGMSLIEWENQFWRTPIESVNKYELYAADIDTTFKLVSKMYCSKSLRVAGEFACKHMPWFVNSEIIVAADELAFYKRLEMCSTISKCT